MCIICTKSVKKNYYRFERFLGAYIGRLKRLKTAFREPQEKFVFYCDSHKEVILGPFQEVECLGHWLHMHWGMSGLDCYELGCRNTVSRLRFITKQNITQ